MLIALSRISREFVVLIAAGLLVFVFFPTGWYAFVCRSHVEHAQGNEQPNGKQDRFKSAAPNGRLGFLNAEQPQPENGNTPGGEHSEQEPIFCETRFTDILLVFLTYCLVVVGWTGIRMSIAAQQNMERAVLSVLFEDINLKHPVMDGHAGGRRVLVIQPILSWKFFNSGRTAAFIDSVMIGFTASLDAPSAPPYSDVEELHLLDKSVAQNDSSEIASATLDEQLANEKIELLKRGDLFIWFYGSVSYLDVFEQLHNTVFCYRSAKDASLRMWGGKKYNYTT